MEFEEVVRRRRMVRAYAPERQVSRKSIHRFIDLAIHAPSAGSSQGWHFLVLDDGPARSAFWAATTDGELADTWLTGLQTAPALIVALSDKQAYLDRYAEPDKGWTDRSESRWPVPYWDLDTAMASMLILLAAVDEGLGCCFFGVPAEHWDRLRAAFTIPERLTPIGVISVGYPAPDRRSPSLRRGRTPASDVTSYGHYAGA
jgi:nitroreductase